jgi:glucose-6-phosphate 1-dehydrogenase
VQSDVTVERTVQTPCGELTVERPAPVADPATVVIFGATGDLAKRKLLPALYNLNADHLLPAGFSVVGRGREPLTTDAYDRLRDTLAAAALADGGRPSNTLFYLLGKETVQNIMAFRFANGIFEPIWNRRYVDHVQITAAL